MEKIVILGKIPSPIGGVTIHVFRLLARLELSNVKYVFRRLNKLTLLLLPFLLAKCPLIHVHSSNPYIRYLVCVLAKFYTIKTIVTFHGDLLRYKSGFKNYLDFKTIGHADFPIVLNENSYKISKRLNNNSRLISAFIPPILENEYLNAECIEQINILKNTKKIMFCTNAFNMSFDKNKNEIYGIFELIDFFIKNSKYGLVFSDPSGVYSNEFSKRQIIIPDNIFVIKDSHSFFKILTLCDVSIRNTSTDGDSLSVKESIFLNILTLCTDVVSRPKEAFVYKRGTIGTVINSININNQNIIHSTIKDGSEELIDLYRQNLNI